MSATYPPDPANPTRRKDDEERRRPGEPAPDPNQPDEPQPDPNQPDDPAKGGSGRA